MPSPAMVIRILIGGPSDTTEYKDAADRLVREWNASHSKSSGMVFLPIRWEIDTFPKYGPHPQTVVNVQAVDDCDAMIAIFCDRLGTPTESNVSGTVEELERLHSADKEVAVYFYDGKVGRESALNSSVQHLEEFKQATRQKGLHRTFADLRSFENQLHGHIAHLGNVFAESVARTAEQKSHTTSTSNELASIVRRHYLAWQAEEMSEPVGIEAAVALLDQLRRDLTTLDVSSGAASTEAYSKLVEVISRISRLQRHRLYTDSIVAHQMFWIGGNEVFAQLHELIDVLEKPDQGFQIEPTQSEYDRQLLRAILTLSHSPPYKYSEREVKISLLVKNIGQHVANNIVLASRTTDSDRRTFGTISSLEPGTLREHKYPFARTRNDRREDLRVDEDHILELRYDDGAGSQSTKARLHVSGQAPNLMFTLEQLDSSDALGEHDAG